MGHTGTDIHNARTRGRGILAQRGKVVERRIRTSASENVVDVGGSLAVLVRPVRSIGHEKTRFGKGPTFGVVELGKLA